MTHSDLSADAFMRRILADPSDAVPRLVFADWLEETDRSSNIAWARYLRLAEELASVSAGNPRHPKLTAELGRIRPLVQARMTYRADIFVEFPEAMLRLLPARNMVLKLDSLMLPHRISDLIPAMSATEYAVLPLARMGRTLAVAALDPPEADSYLRLQWILNMDLLPIRTFADQLQAAIERHYGHPSEWEVVTSGPNEDQHRCVFGSQTQFGILALNDPSTIDRRVRQLLRSALQDRATVLELEPLTGEWGPWVQVWHTIQNNRIAADTFPAEILSLVTDRVRVMAGFDSGRSGVIPLVHRGLTYRLPVRITDTPLGPHILILIPASPTDPHTQVVNPAA